MSSERAYRFTHALCRRPGHSIAQGLRAVDAPDPDPQQFLQQHDGYVQALRQAGVEVELLDSAEEFPDSVFIEDAAVIVDGVAVLMRPGANTRRGEVGILEPTLRSACRDVIQLPGQGTIDGGDVLLTSNEALIGLSDRTTQTAIDAFGEVLQAFGYVTHSVTVPSDVLHFKSDCGLLDNETVFATKRLAASGCFNDYRVIAVPDGEELAANLIRVNDVVLINTGYPQSEALLTEAGYNVHTVDTSEAARVDGGLSCLSLRYTR